jgi:fused signal recognition particle receptor
MSFFDKLKQGLHKTKIAFGFTKVDDNLLEELEEQLIMADVGLETSEEIVKNLRTSIKSKGIEDADAVKNEIKEILKDIFKDNDSKLHIENSPSVILMVGVNGAGKTTSIGKIASKLTQSGKKVLIAAGDTFRAAAVEQLEVWAQRANADIVKGKENEDPSSVIFAACDKAKNENYDVLICDTAGRLQNKKYLMDELEKMKRVIDRELPDSSKETILVLDGSTGQNAISQVNSFSECTGITGLIITKLDGTAKGGVIIRLVKENNIPIKFIGVGEKIDDMEEFNSEEFINAIIS